VGFCCRLPETTACGAPAASSFDFALTVGLGGTFHNGNENHLSTGLLNKLTKTGTSSKLEQLTRREYALICCGLGAMIYAFLPLLLHYLGTRWNPGVPRQVAANSRNNGQTRQDKKRVSGELLDSV